MSQYIFLDLNLHHGNINIHDYLMVLYIIEDLHNGMNTHVCFIVLYIIQDLLKYYIYMYIHDDVALCIILGLDVRDNNMNIHVCLQVLYIIQDLNLHHIYTNIYVFHIMLYIFIHFIQYWLCIHINDRILKLYIVLDLNLHHNYIYNVATTPSVDLGQFPTRLATLLYYYKLFAINIKNLFLFDSIIISSSLLVRNQFVLIFISPNVVKSSND